MINLKKLYALSLSLMYVSSSIFASQADPVAKIEAAIKDIQSATENATELLKSYTPKNALDLLDEQIAQKKARQLALQRTTKQLQAALDNQSQQIKVIKEFLKKYNPKQRLMKPTESNLSSMITTWDELISRTLQEIKLH